ncbi:MAG: hypothetical protein K2P81_16795 [Bacteriovoracaceae bacterium]|nr:hypothetical protein [Bacteriovoracaceae bacterium]
MSKSTITAKNVFSRNPSAVHVKKNDKLNIVFTDKESADLITLEGFVGEFFLACDGTTAASDLAKKLGQNLTPEIEPDFEKMLNFLVERELIVSA